MSSAKNSDAEVSAFALRNDVLAGTVTARPKKARVESGAGAVWSPLFSDMSKPYRAQRVATEAGAIAAVILTILHALNGLALSAKSSAQWALLGYTPAQLAIAHLGFVLLGMLLALRLWRHGGVWSAAVLTLWSLFVCVPGPATWLYGHMAPTTIHWGVPPLALASLVAAWRFRRQTGAQGGAA